MSPTINGRLRRVVVTLLSVPGLLLAQQPPSGQVTRKVEMKPGVVATTDLELASEAIAAVELGLDLKAIKERPFQAELVVETVKKLADGNSLKRTSTAMFYRDSQGRLREEKGEHSSTDQQSDQETRISITDPATGTHIFLFPSMKMGFRMQAPTAFLKEMQTNRTTPWTPRRNQKVTTTPLGNQIIEGLHCEGRMDTVIIPAGSSGNPFPIEISTERWYSADLQIYLVVKRIDPRNGETTIRLNKMNLEEPQKSLFEVPAGYDIREGGTTAMP